MVRQLLSEAKYVPARGSRSMSELDARTGRDGGGTPGQRGKPDGTVRRAFSGRHRDDRVSGSTRSGLEYPGIRLDPVYDAANARRILTNLENTP